MADFELDAYDDDDDDPRHQTKYHKDNQLQSLKLPLDYPSWVSRCDLRGPLV